MSQEFEEELEKMWRDTLCDVGKTLTVVCNSAEHESGHGADMEMTHSVLSSRGSLETPLFIYHYKCDCGAAAAVILNGENYKK